MTSLTNEDGQFEEVAKRSYKKWKQGVEDSEYLYRGITVPDAKIYVDNLIKEQKNVGVSWTYNKKLSEQFATVIEKQFAFIPDLKTESSLWR